VTDLDPTPVAFGEFGIHQFLQLLRNWLRRPQDVRNAQSIWQLGSWLCDGRQRLVDIFKDAVKARHGLRDPCVCARPGTPQLSCPCHWAVGVRRLLTGPIRSGPGVTKTITIQELTCIMATYDILGNVAQLTPSKEIQCKQVQEPARFGHDLCAGMPTIISSRLLIIIVLAKGTKRRSSG